MQVDIEDIREFAREQYNNANRYAERIKFANDAVRKSLTANRQIEIQASIGDDPELDELEIGDGIAAWAAILAVDLRNSTKLADRLGSRKTYLMSHTLLPTLVFVCEKNLGVVMNLRGDGLFSAFGIQKRRSESDPNDSPEESHVLDAHRDAVSCGLSLIMATKQAVQFVLEENGVKANLALGAGVHSGHVVVTRVGWMKANELTAYGSPVNHACKLSGGINEVRVSPKVEKLFPSSPNGTLRFDNHGDYLIATTPNLIVGRS